MRKSLKNWAMLLLCALLPAICQSCGDDDKDEPKPIPVFNPFNALYEGTTTTDAVMQGMPLSFTTQETGWQVVIDNSTKTASVKVYDARFAEMMPAQSLLVLDGLTYDPLRLEIRGTDIVPLSLEGDALTPNPNYTFTNLKLVYANSKAEDVTIDFSVNHRGLPFTGKFKGHYTLESRPVN